MALYKMICKHFLATLSPDAIFMETELGLMVGGTELSIRGMRCLDEGWTKVTDDRLPDDKTVPDALHEGTSLPVEEVRAGLHQNGRKP